MIKQSKTKWMLEMKAVTVLGAIQINKWQSRAGVGNSFGFAGHIRDKLGIPGPAHVYTNWFWGCFYDIAGIFWMFNVFL